MLARLWQSSDRPAAPKPLPGTGDVDYRPEPPPSLPIQDRSRKRRQKRVRVCRLYPKPPSEPLIHARALLAHVQHECPEYVGGYVPRPDLDACYHEFCKREGWKPRHWTAIARQLGELTDRKTVRDCGQRFVGYQIPKP